jgi:hypothetical protein
VVARNDEPVVVDDLQDWESGPLSEFLARRQQGSSAQVHEDDRVLLRDVPNERRRGGRYIGPVTDEGFYPFGN